LGRKQREVPASPRQRDPALPEDLDALCMQLLAREPERRPDGHAILAALGAQASPALVALERMVAARPFVGRTAELATLRQALDDARAHAVTVFVSGESGIGKSQLVRRFLDELAGADTIVLEGRCYERESVPYKALDSLVDALTAVLLGVPDQRLQALLPPEVGTLARLFPVLRRVPVIAGLAMVARPPAAPPELRAVAFAALRALFAALARDAPPLLIAIDDLQWGDPDSAVLLAELVHDDAPLPLLLVLVHRPEDDGGVVARIRAPLPGLAAGDVRAIEVGPLPELEARALIAAAGGGSAAAELLRDAGGHPLFLAELAATAQRDVGAPTRFEDLVARRIAALSPSAAALLCVTAVAARPLPIELAARAAEVTLDGSEVPRLRAERLVRARRFGETDVEHVEPYHDRVRHAVVASLAPDRVRAVHEALARAYEAAGARHDLEALVAHWLAAGQTGRAAACAVDAALDAEEALAFHRAASLYAVALAHGRHDDGARRRLLRRHGEALSNAGRLEEAAAAFAQAAQGAEPDDAFELDVLRLGQLLRRGLLIEGREMSRRMLAPLGIELPATRAKAIRAVLVQLMRTRLRGLGFTARAAGDVPRAELRKVDLLASTATALGIAEPVVGRVVQAHRLRAALDCGDPDRICMALAIELGYRAQKGTRSGRRLDEAVAVLRGLAATVDNHQARGLADAMQGFMQFQCGRWQEARGLIESGLAILRQHVVGMRWEITVSEQTLIGSLFYLGDARELTRLVPRLLREAIERGDTYALDAQRAWRGHTAWLCLDRPDEARRFADAVALPRPSPEDVQIRHHNELVTQVQIDLYEGKAAAARQRVEAMLPVLEASLLHTIQILRIEGNLVRGRALLAVAMGVGERERAAVLAPVRRAIKQLAHEDAPWASAIAAMFRGLVAWLDGDARAAAHLEAAERGFDAAGMPLYADAVRVRRGQLEGGAGGEARAAAALELMRARGVANPRAMARMLCPWRE
jgi:eukaryotic-like serine/threonine-protein kinase